MIILTIHFADVLYVRKIGPVSRVAVDDRSIVRDKSKLQFDIPYRNWKREEQFIGREIS